MMMPDSVTNTLAGRMSKTNIAYFFCITFEEREVPFDEIGINFIPIGSPFADKIRRRSWMTVSSARS